MNSPNLNNHLSFPFIWRILFLLTVFLIFFTNTSQAQLENRSRNAASESYWKLGVGYLSNYVYMGRQDSLPTPYLTPTIGYYHSSGFYLSCSLSYLLEKKSRRIDYGSIDIGYSFDLSERVSGEVYANKSWYNQSSTNVASDIKGYLGGVLGYDVDFIQVNGGMDLLFSNKPDFTCNLGFSHVFEFGGNDNAVSVEPTFTTNWSTLHSYEGYINRRVGKRPGTGIPLNTTVTAVTKVQNNRLTLMDFEVSLPFTYESSHFGINFTPTLAIPRNPIYTTTTITTTTPGGIQNSQTYPSTPNSELNLQNRFYAELTLSFKF
ncbi:MAG: hypothetical protein FGM61_07065 [Sediminibacterium sp.]|nr:hypothetical protein [Sediminibacterium sp.]